MIFYRRRYQYVSIAYSSELTGSTYNNLPNQHKIDRTDNLKKEKKNPKYILRLFIIYRYINQ